MQSQHYAATRTEERSSLRAWIGPQRPNFEGKQTARPAAMAPLETQVQISAEGMAAQSTEAVDASQDALQNDPVLALVKAMVEWMTGKPVKVFNPAQLQATAPPPAAPPPDQGQAAPPPPAAGFGVEYDYHAVREEVEQTRFSAQGIVKTADGKTIAFSLDLTMSRQYREETNVELRAGDAKRKDPLVINFAGTAAQLSDRQFRFDLNNDGTTENLSLLNGGSGFLAIDLNHNGKINSGAELFGPASGSGFAELARHDQDRNGWIDENDAVFNQLRVWSPDAAGNGTLSTLSDRDIGAIYLGQTRTPFELRGADNRDLGAIKNSGVYLTESGGSGSIQEIDLSV